MSCRGTVLVEEGHGRAPKLGAASATSVSFVLLVFFLMAASVSISGKLLHRLPSPRPRGGRRRRSIISGGDLVTVRLATKSALLIGGRPVGLRGLGRRAIHLMRHLNGGRLVSVRDSHSTGCGLCFRVRGRLVRTCTRLHGRTTRGGCRESFTLLGGSRGRRIHGLYPRHVARSCTGTVARRSGDVSTSIRRGRRARSARRGKNTG